MSEDLIKIEGGVPAHIASRAASTELAGLIVTGSGIGRISYKGKQFRIRQPGQDDVVAPLGAPLICVIADAFPRDKRLSKVYYKGDYIPGQDNPPDCSSAFGEVPDPWIENPPAKSCASCAYNVFGSGKGGRGKACKDVKQLLVLPPNKIQTDAMPLLLSVPPASLRHLTSYAKALADAGNIPFWYVRTEVSFAETEHPELVFKFAGFLTEEQCKVMDAIREGDILEDAVSRLSSAPPSAGDEAPDAAQTAAPAAEEAASEAPTELHEPEDETSKVEEILKDWG